jgi:hypothetical protein
MDRLQRSSSQALKRGSSVARRMSRLKPGPTFEARAKTRITAKTRARKKTRAGAKARSVAMATVEQE